MEVRELVRHILLHVDAEAGGRDGSQAGGVAARARYVRRVLGWFTIDTRDLPANEVLEEISNAAPAQASRAAFRRSVANMLDEPRPQLAFQAWVGKNQERRGVGKERGQPNG